jgi:transcriptional regulator with XRE-family HTH domain
MPDYGLTVTMLADTLGVSLQTVNELLRERRALSPALALRLSRLFGNSPEFWLQRPVGRGPLADGKGTGKGSGKDLHAQGGLMVLWLFKKKSQLLAGFSRW